MACAELFRRALDNIRPPGKVRQLGGYKTGLYPPRSATTRAAAEMNGCSRARGAVRGPALLAAALLHGRLCTQREEQWGYRPTAGNQGRVGALREPLPCWSAFTEGHVTAEGKLSACCFDATAHWTMGDLNRQSFMEAWNSVLFVKLRAAHLKKDVSGTVCEKCVAYQESA